MKCRPDQSAPRPHKAIALRNPRHQAANAPASQRKDQQESDLLTDPMPIHQDQRQYPPDRDIVQTRVAQDALTYWLAQNLELLHEQDQDR
jgi:hypothetical protein